MGKKCFVFILVSISFTLAVGIKAQESYGVLKSIGWKQLRAGKYNQAVNYFKKAIKVKPSDYQAYRGLAHVYRKTKKYNRAVFYFRKAAALKPDYALLEIEIAGVYSKLKKYNLAVNSYIKALSIFRRLNKRPYSSGIYFQLSNILLNNLNKKRPAVYYLIRAAKVFNKNGFIHYHLGNVYKNHFKDTNNAYKHYKIALKLYLEQKKKPPVWLVMVSASMILNKFKKPNTAFNFILKLKHLYKHTPLYFLHIGNMYMSIKKYRTALRYFDYSILLYKRKNKLPNIYTYSHAGVVCLFYMKPRQYLRGINYFKQILYNRGYKMSSKEYTVVWLARAYRESGRYKKLLNLANKYLHKLKNSKSIKSFHNTLLYYHYRQTLDLKKAYYHAKKAGNVNMMKKLSPKKVTITYKLRFKEMMEKYIKHLKPGIIRINLPIDRAYQKLLYVKSSFKYKRIFKIHDRNYVEFDFSRGFPEKLVLEISVITKTINLMPDKFYAVTNPNHRYYYFANAKTKYYDIHNPVLVNFVKRITGNKYTLKQKVYTLWKWIAKNITHWSVYCKRNNIPDTVENWPKYKHVSEVFKKRVGGCWNISDLFVAFMRILRIPARKLGIVGHVPAELYNVENKQWMYVEAQGSPPLGINPGSVIAFNYRKRRGVRDPKHFLGIGWIGHIHRWKIYRDRTKFRFIKIEYLNRDVK